MSSLNSSLPCKVIYLLVQGIRTPTSLGVGEELFYLSRYGTSHITAKFYLKLDNQKAKYQNHVLSTLQGNEVPKLCLNLTSTFIEGPSVFRQYVFFKNNNWSSCPARYSVFFSCKTLHFKFLLEFNFRKSSASADVFIKWKQRGLQCCLPYTGCQITEELNPSCFLFNSFCFVLALKELWNWIS